MSFYCIRAKIVHHGSSTTQRRQHLASEGQLKLWKMRREMKSPNYTTQWSELPVVRFT
ncbi:DUF4113 domain-containing protein [Legionella israelensis]|nr:DUF4113 domain-containing protein [Legionella israelensis]